MEKIQVEVVFSSKEKVVAPAAEPSKVKKRLAEAHESKACKKSKVQQENETTALKLKLATPVDVDDIHLESCKDVSFPSLQDASLSSLRFRYALPLILELFLGLGNAGSYSNFLLSIAAYRNFFGCGGS